MSERRPARPPQVSLAGWMVVGGSVLVVLLAFQQVADLRSLETRESVERYLSEPPGDALGIGVQGVLQVLRITAMVSAACAAATAILGWHALQRSTGARLALSVLALPLLVSGLISGGVASAVVVAATTMLWFQPARDWFAGRVAPTVPARTVPGAPAAPAGTRDPLLDLPPPTSAPLYAVDHAAARGATPETASARPAALRWACALTWATSGLAALLLGIALVVLVAQPDALLEEVRRQNPQLSEQGVTDGLVRTTVYVTCAVLIAWSLAAVALGVLAWRRVRWAWLVLMVSAGCAAGLCLLLLLGSVAMLVPLAACAGTLSLLLRPETRAWFTTPTR